MYFAQILFIEDADLRDRQPEQRVDAIPEGILSVQIFCLTWDLQLDVTCMHSHTVDDATCCYVLICNYGLDLVCNLSGKFMILRYGIMFMTQSSSDILR